MIRRRGAPLLRWVALLAVSLAGLAVSVLALELGTRWAGLRFRRIAPVLGTRALWVYDATKGWFHAPGSLGESGRGGPDRGLVRINSLGLRGPEVAVAKPPGVGRVLLVGDSFAFGVGVDEEHLFPTLLEGLLNQRTRFRHRYEVVNLGVSGYATDQQYILLQELGLRFEPDLVILLVCENDFADNTVDFIYDRYYKPFFETGPGGSLLRRNVPVPRLSTWQRAKLWLAWHSNAWNMLRTRQSDSPLFRGVLGSFQVAVSRRPADPPAEITWALVRAIDAAVKQHGAQLLVMNTGAREEDPAWFRGLSRRMSEAGMDNLRMTALLRDARRADPSKRWDFQANHDTHWNVDAHRFVAEVVAERIGPMLEGGESRPDHLKGTSFRPGSHSRRSPPRRAAPATRRPGSRHTEARTRSPRR